MAPSNSKSPRARVVIFFSSQTRTSGSVSGLPWTNQAKEEESVNSFCLNKNSKYFLEETGRDEACKTIIFLEAKPGLQVALWQLAALKY